MSKLCTHVKQKTLITSVLLFLIFPSTFYALATNGFFKNNYPVMFENGSAILDIEIKTKREAILYAISHGLLEKPDYNGVEARINFEISWEMTAIKNDNRWIVYIKTTKVLPSYSCAISFDIRGQSLNKQEKRCSGNK